jgi:DNA-binding response OmpR family regulator
LYSVGRASIGKRKEGHKMDRYILLVTGDLTYNEDFAKATLKRSFFTDFAKTMDDAFELIAKNDYLLLDICADNVDYMPELNVIHQFREMPILVYSYMEPSDQLAALQNGAQLFISRPASIEYIVESSLAMARYYQKIRLHGPNAGQTLLTYGSLHMGVETHQVFMKGRNVLLTRKEFDLLHYFIINKGIVLTYEQIYNNVWGWGADLSYDNYNVLHSLVRRLRKKLDTAPGTNGYISSVWEVGYKFSAI